MTQRPPGPAAGRVAVAVPPGPTEQPGAARARTLARLATEGMVYLVY